jgi:hypothetical protein
MTIVTAAPVRVRMSKVFEGTLVYANVSPPEATRPIPIKVSCPNFMAPPYRILYAKSCLSEGIGLQATAARLSTPCVTRAYVRL